MRPTPPFGIVSIKNSWPTSPNYIEQSFAIVIDFEPKFTSAYFWAQQFWFDNGDGGYLGIQSDGNINKTRQKIAIFSIWKAIGADRSPIEGSSAETFGHEGSGYSCKIPFFGTIGVPRDWGNLKGDSNFFVEYFRQVSSCEDTPYAKTLYASPAMIEKSEIRPVKCAYETYGPCASIGKIKENDDSTFTIDTGQKK